MEPRSFGVQIFYNHVEATEDISPYLNSFTYTDPIDESDTIAISLLDREGTWAAGWIPKKEDQIRPNILLRNWRTENAERLSAEILWWMISAFPALRIC